MRNAYAYAFWVRYAYAYAQKSYPLMRQKCVMFCVYCPQCGHFLSFHWLGKERTDRTTKFTMPHILSKLKRLHEEEEEEEGLLTILASPRVS